MKFIYASIEDLEEIHKLDTHIKEEALQKKIMNDEVIIVTEENRKMIGFLRFNYFWDCIPFMNMLQVISTKRRKGIGKKLVAFWETEMEKKGHNLVMTSTQSDEDAQHFYRKLQYKEKGSFILNDDPLEIIFAKSLESFKEVENVD